MKERSLRAPFFLLGFFQVYRVAAFASKPAPTGECISNVGAGLLAKAVSLLVHYSGFISPIRCNKS
ncbi:hypothetical protein C2E19_25565 [Pseudomonas sp. DTU12.3]|nr:hypothetical protein C2E19_25565 [Pseudomonas sp. DTU12.3]